MFHCDSCEFPGGHHLTLNPWKNPDAVMSGGLGCIRQIEFQSATDPGEERVSETGVTPGFGTFLYLTHNAILERVLHGARSFRCS